ncbi:RHS repeat-associated core domain-containing protein [Burkholderia sp. BCC0044]|uniref:RHS repeat-associated core domain-containing protein n=1 Tax=Burkholderia sp. BCC0044 TaxID=2676295 RepID=UPI001589FB49|nr:RHS repeat-associated core domain-containing protein [Burkholderia sp. BCC0044]
MKTSYTYEPYGNTSATGEANANVAQYTGRENDGAGLYYYRARYYHPGISRFVAEDSIGLAAGANLYAYVSGNPVLFVDPNGHWTRQIGFSFSYTFPFGLSGTYFAGVAYDSEGNIGTYYGGGGGVGVGAGVSGGVSAQASNAKTICDLSGPFGNASAGLGAGANVSADGFWGPSDDGLVIGGGATFGPGLGVTSFNGATNTWVNPIGRFK